MAEELLNQGLEKFKAKNYQGAIANYDSALRLNPDYAIAYYNRGLAKSGLGDKQGALSDFQDAAELYAQQGNTEMHSKALNQIK